MKYLLPLLLSVLFGLACGKSKTLETVTFETDTNQPPISVTAENLTKAYSDNETAADLRYKGKVIEVTGTIKEITETLGKITVSLEGHKEKGFSAVSVSCSFSESEKAKDTRLTKGQSVTLTGTGDGKTLGFYVGLSECRIK